MKGIISASIIAGAIIVSAFVLTSGSVSPADAVPAQNVTVVNGTQIIEIHAKGGFQPRKSIAQAGIPTVLRFTTSGTFDCSSSVRIPSLNVSKILPQSGSTDIAIGNPPTGTVSGTCGMGMYPFEIDFQKQS